MSTNVTSTNIASTNSLFTGIVGITGTSTVGGQLNVTGNILNSGNCIVSGTIPSSMSQVGVLRLSEYDVRSGNGANGYHSFAFIDTNNSIRYIGHSGWNSTNPSSRPKPLVYNTAIILNLPDNEMPLKVYNYPRNLFAISTTNKLYGLGYNGEGQLGIIGNSGIPIKFNCLTDVSNVKCVISNNSAIANASMYAITHSGDAYSWGYNTYGQLGQGSTAVIGRPQKILFETGVYGPVNQICCNGGSNDATDVATWKISTCALVGDAVYCVGYGLNRQMGNNTISETNINWIKPKLSQTTPLPSIKMIGAAGSYDSSTFFALDNANNLYAWGANKSSEATDIPKTGSAFAELISTNVDEFWPCSASLNQACLFIKTKDISNNIYCCGANSYGQLGLGNTATTTTLTKCTSLNGYNVKSIITSGNGGAPTIFAVVDSFNGVQLLGCGYNSGGLGYVSDIVSNFTPIYFDCGPGVTISNVMTSQLIGFRSTTIILTSNNKLYGMGYSNYNWFSCNNLPASQYYIKQITNILC